MKADEYPVGGHAIAISPAGDRVYVTGRLTGPRDFDPTRTYADNRDLLAPLKSGKEYDIELKLGPTNQFQWVKGLIGNGLSGDSDGGRGRLALDAQGSVYVADVFHGAVGDLDIEHSYPGNIDRVAGNGGSFVNTIFVAKYSPGGAFRWAATADGSTSTTKHARGLAVTDGGVHLLASIAFDTVTVTPGGATFSAPAGADILQLTFAQTADPVMVYAKNVYTAEGSSGTTGFTFQLFLSDPVTVSFSTANGTAAAGSDYTAAAGAVTFQPGQTQATVTDLVAGDNTGEADETFALVLAPLTPGVDASPTAWATIANDDGSGGKRK